MKKLRDELENIYGIGPKYANELLRSGKVKVGKGSARKQLKKIKEELPLATRADLKYRPSRKIPHVVIADIAKTLKTKLRGIKHEIAGSYRRKKPTSRDIDLIVSGTNYKSDTLIKKINHNNRKFQVVHIFAEGDSKISAIISYKAAASKNKKINIKADIFLTEPSEYMFMLLFATGSGRFNVRMRSLAKRRGYLLNQRGLYKRTPANPDILKLVPIKNEKHLFDVLKMKYLKPPDRKS